MNACKKSFADVTSARIDQFLARGLIGSFLEDPLRSLENGRLTGASDADRVAEAAFVFDYFLPVDFSSLQADGCAVRPRKLTRRREEGNPLLPRQVSQPGVVFGKIFQHRGTRQDFLVGVFQLADFFLGNHRVFQGAKLIGRTIWHF